MTRTRETRETRMVVGMSQMMRRIGVNQTTTKTRKKKSKRR